MLDISPLIDCVLQLLVFFMLSSTFASPKLDLALPKAESTDGMTDTSAIVISIDAAGNVLVDHERIGMGDLDARLAELAPSGRSVTFRGDAQVPFQTFMSVLDSVKRAGFSVLDLAHENASVSAPNVEE